MSSTNNKFLNEINVNCIIVEYFEVTSVLKRLKVAYYFNNLDLKV